MADDKEKDLAAALYTVIMQAEFIGPEYRTIAGRYKNKPAILKEIILCACDGVDALVMQAVEQKVPQDASFSRCRRKHWEKQLFQSYHEELESILHTVNSIESGMRSVSSQISVIEDKVPTMEELFQNKIPQDVSDIVEVDELSDVKAPLINKDSIEEGVPNFGTSSLMKNIGEVIKNHAASKRRMKEYERARQKEQSRPPLSKWFSSLEKQGYSSEQLQFVLKCVEEGLEREQIMNIIAPNLSVDVMENLKKLEMKK